MIYNYSLGIFFALLNTILFIWSIFKKDKKEMIKIQSVGQIFVAISNFFLYSYSAVITCIINALRNYLTYKGKLSKNITIIFFMFYIIFGLAVNSRGLIGIFPIMSACTYLIFCFISNNAQTLRCGLIVNQNMALVHDIFIKAYPSVITEVLVIIISIYNILKFNKKNEHNETNIYN